jgi:hypothetical protein
MIPSLLAFAFDLDTSLPIKILAAIGGGAVGGLLVGLLVQMVVKLAFAQTVPRAVLWFVRILGGLACGLLVWSLLGGGGGLGFGGGGSGPGKGGADKGKKEERKDREKEKEKGKDKGKKDATPTPPGQVLRVEVLGNDDLKRIAGDRFDPKKRYRVLGRPGLLGLEEVKDLILQRRDAKPPLRELIVELYRNSPAQDKEQVTAVVAHAEDVFGKDREKLKVSYSVHPDQDAPVD